MWWLIIIAFYIAGITTNVLSNKMDRLKNEGGSEDDPKKRKLIEHFISRLQLLELYFVSLFFMSSDGCGISSAVAS